MTSRLLALTGLTRCGLEITTRRLRDSSPVRGRPWALPLQQRALVACASLRTNLTLRELAAVVGIATMTRRLAVLLGTTDHRDRRWSWVVDGTLIPTRDHASAAKSKNYRWSCNAQVLIRRADLRVVAITGGGPGNRNDPIHFRGSEIEAHCRRHGRVLADGGYRGVKDLRTPVFRRNRIVRDRAWRLHRRRRARVEHAIARLKDWRVLRDHRRGARSLDATLRAVAFLHNLGIALRDNS